VLTGTGTCGRGPYLLTLFGAGLLGLGLGFSFLWVVLMLMGPGPGPYEPQVNRFAFGVMSGLALLFWALIGQTIRRVRSAGQPWLGLPLLLGIAFPALLIPTGLVLALWPGRVRAAEAPTPQAPLRFAVRSLAVLLLLLCALIGAPAGITLYRAIQSGALSGPPLP
jgi:hypothetical protein